MEVRSGAETQWGWDAKRQPSDAGGGPAGDGLWMWSWRPLPSARRSCWGEKPSGRGAGRWSPDLPRSSNTSPLQSDTPESQCSWSPWPENEHQNILKRTERSEALIMMNQMQPHCVEETKAKQTRIVTWPVCMFVLSPLCFGFNTHWKALTNPQQCSLWMWPHSPPMDLWKQTQSQGQVLLLSCRHFPTSSILPLTLISTLIWSKGNSVLKFHYGVRWSAIHEPITSSLPFPPVAWSIFKWSTVICNISAFSNLADPLGEEIGYVFNMIALMK